MAIGHDNAIALRATYLARHRRSDAQFARHGVTADQFVLLAALAGGGAVTQWDLALRTLSDPNTVRAMLLLLENRGLIARTPDPADGRVRTVALTPKGGRAYRALREAGKPVRARQLASLGPNEPETLLDLLGEITRSVGPTDQPDSRTRVPSRTRS
jgi:DNA-binding MarR family transcriptional regulator